MQDCSPWSNPQVHAVGVPYWFLPDEGGTMTPATYEEMADTADVYLKVGWSRSCKS